MAHIGPMDSQPGRREKLTARPMPQARLTRRTVAGSVRADLNREVCAIHWVIAAPRAAIQPGGSRHG